MVLGGAILSGGNYLLLNYHFCTSFHSITTYCLFFISLDVVITSIDEKKIHVHTKCIHYKVGMYPIYYLLPELSQHKRLVMTPSNDFYIKYSPQTPPSIHQAEQWYKVQCMGACCHSSYNVRNLTDWPMPFHWSYH